ncbi:hypothetical protein IKD60_01860, partial [Candidatus Saccharibacteria bacterium]|nr:hypothetical protein [Candidatus Saccharibacteria bacterium]
KVLEGDGGEHIIGSEDPLVFKIDNDITEFCDTGNLIIDGEYQDMRTDCEVDLDNQTITLPASLLNVLALGEHSFEAYFTEPDSGSAKASFKIVELRTDDDDDDNNNDIRVPDSGALTSEGGSAEMNSDFVAAIAAVAGIAVVAFAHKIAVKRVR